MNPPLRYALLRHDCPLEYRDGPHWDLMFERADARREHRLATWSLLSLPAAWAEALSLPGPVAQEPLPATELPDHRAAYLSYEGRVSGDRGTVTRQAGWQIEWLGTEADRLVLRLIDGPIAGRLVLDCLDGTSWNLRLA